MAAELVPDALWSLSDTAKARAAYEEFLTLWKNADPDIPVLKQARSEYAKFSVGKLGGGGP